MDKETIIKKLTHPLVCIVAITVAVGTGVAYGCINHIRNEKQEIVSNADVMVYKEATLDELIVLRAQDLEQTTTSPIDSESQERMIQAVSDYFAARYNFKGSYSANKERIVEAIKPLITPDFLISIEKSFTESKKLEGTDREMKDYHCEVLNVYRNGYSESELKSKGIQPSYFCLVKINGRNTLYQIKMEYADGEYRIGSQDMLGTEQEAKK
ncbi:MAG: hypothetical protein UIH27_16910 [Ruminococcus sp.]|nr:hypothetical protein [Ruminococcus sp.]